MRQQGFSQREGFDQGRVCPAPAQPVTDALFSSPVVTATAPRGFREPAEPMGWFSVPALAFIMPCGCASLANGLCD